MKILLYVYLGISILTFILYWLKSKSLAKRVANEYKDELAGRKYIKDISGEIFAWTRLFIMSFIPLLNIIFLCVILFNEEEFDRKATEKALKVVKDTEIKEGKQ